MSFKKISSFFLIAIMILANVFAFNSNAQGEDYDSKYIKIGLKEKLGPKSIVKLSGSGFSIGIERGEMNRLFDTNDSNIIAKPEGFSYHIEISQTFSSYEEALEKSRSLNSLGADAYVVYHNGFKVYIGAFGSDSSAKDYLFSNAALGSEATIISRNEPLVSLENTNAQKIISFDKNQGIFVKSLNDITKIENIEYRGFVGFTNNGNLITTVNYVKIGDYLKGVVPREMPASWDIEALKAQAVAARSYTLRTQDKHKADGYSLCDTTHCQVYGGYSVEHPNSTRAVEETKSRVLKHNGTIVETLYSSCNGGYIANNEDVWGGTAVPYLRGKEDPYSLNTPHSNWTVTMTRTEASNKLKAAGYDVGQISSIEVITGSSGPYVIELKVTGTSGTKVIPKGRVRNIFGLKSANYRIENSSQVEVPTPVPEAPSVPTKNTDVYVAGGDNISRKAPKNSLSVMTAEGVKTIDLNSDKTVISNGTNKTFVNSNKEEKPSTPQVQPSTPSTIGGTIVIKGSGNGHGVGMSQHGANNMSKQGFNYTDILEFYYTGARVE